MDTRPTYSLIIGRFQPFHAGHQALIQSVIDAGGTPLVAIRDTPIDDKNPYTITERWDMVTASFPTIKIMSIPDIAEVVYGRDVGYGVRKVKLPDHIEAISGTIIRELNDPGGGH